MLNLTADEIKTVAPFVAPVIGPIISSIVETHLKPKLAELNKRRSALRKVDENAFISKFDEYLKRAYEKQSYIRTVVFQNQQKQLDDLYIPLTAVRSSKGETYLIDRYAPNFLPHFKRVLLTDTAGMGKSTLLRFLFLECIRQQAGTPIFIELRSLSNDTDIVDVICKDLDAIDEAMDRDFILKLIAKGDFVFFLDGYDEVPLDSREVVTRHLQEFISKARKNLFILSSRPEEALPSFADFEGFTIQPLETEEAFALLRKYGAGDDVAERLIGEIQGATLEAIEEFLTNPLLVSLLYLAYNHLNVIPLEKQTFYRQVYDALFLGHDATKSGFQRQKRSGLSQDSFHRVLRVLGFLTLKLGEVSYDKDEILTKIDQAREQCAGLTFESSDLLEDLLNAVPLFYRDGIKYAWKHKALQDYFAAEFICRDTKEKQNNILRSMVASDNAYRYFNTLDLCYSIDYKTFRNTLIYDMVCAFIEFHDSSYKDFDLTIFSEDELTRRKRVFFGRKVVIVSNKEMDFFKNQISMKKQGEFGYYAEYLIQNHLLSPKDDIEFMIKYSDVTLLCFRVGYDLIQRICRCKDESFISLCDLGDNSGDINESLHGRSVTVIDDDPYSPYNSQDLFSTITNLVTRQFFYERTHSNGVALHLDIHQCRSLKVQIERDLVREANKDFLVGGL